ncbi:hypothetical protein [Mycobacterium marinum]|uniref:hypothetical protein n=1 Tax=Mycobacterium marinum TaxID=1781 RepID=UPI0039C8F1AF
MRVMSETSEASAAPTSTVVAPPPPPQHQTPKVFKAAAWVAIVAGIVFIVSVIFFTGFRLGMHSGHGGFHRGHHHKHHPAMMLRPGMHHGGAAAVSPGSGPGGPGEVPTSVAPSTTPGR